MAAPPSLGIPQQAPAPLGEALNDSSAQAAKLAGVLAEFAERLVQGFEIQEILDHLVLRIVDVLPVTGAGVMLMGPSNELHFAAASNKTILAMSTLQNEFGEGPCLEAYSSGEAVAIPDLKADRRFPNFSASAREAGLAAVFTFPMSIEGHRFGALDLYRDESGSLDGSAMEAAQVLANVAAAYLHYAHDRALAADSMDEVRQESLHDPLTGLPNRTLLKERLERAVARANRSTKLVAVLFVDLDRFKAVNDDHGHHVGDLLLVAVADRLTHLLRNSDTVARLSGDEFVVICEDLDREDEAETIASKTAEALGEVFHIEGEALQVSASIGVAFCGPAASVPETILRNADFAMYQAKQAGGARHRVIDHAARMAAARRKGLTHDLREALADGHLQLAYQPVVSVSEGVLEGVEALLRWRHPKHGWVAPNEILPFAEASGLILPIGEWVLTQACRDFVTWKQHGQGIPHVTVNVSPLQVVAPDFELTVAQVLAATGMDPQELFLEVTENVFLDDGPRAFSVLQAINDLGVRLIMDDFGTGYSSLDYLRRFPFEILKIDQVFTANVNSDPQTRTIVASVIALAHGLDLTVVAEGVETIEQLEELGRLGADRVQGYYLCHPLLIDDFDRTVLHPATTLPVHLPIQSSPSSSERPQAAGGVESNRP